MPSMPLMNGDQATDHSWIPASCINAAEYIIKVAIMERAPAWDMRGMEKFGRPVYLHLKDKVLNASRGSNFDVGSKNCQSFDFQTKERQDLELGEGVCFLRKEWIAGKGGFNMHFMAVLFAGGGEYLLSNAMELDTWDEESMVLLEEDVTMLRVRNVGNETWPRLLEQIFEKAARNFIIGLLTTKRTNP